LATAQIYTYRIDHNRMRGGVEGMAIHIGFTVQGLMGRPGEVTAYFNYWNGPALRDFDNAYRTDDGHVGVGVDFVPGFSDTSYSDMQIFMPYSQLDMEPGEVPLMCQIVIWDKSLPIAEELARSPWIQFYYSSR
jgi:hypothetical protein